MDSSLCLLPRTNRVFARELAADTHRLPANEVGIWPVGCLGAREGHLESGLKLDLPVGG